MFPLLTVMLLWFAGQAATAPTVGPTGTERVAGTVIHTETLRPFAGVRIELRTEEYGKRLNTHEKPCSPGRDLEDTGARWITRTDAEGRFSLEDIPPGRYYLVATHEGYLPATYNPQGRPSSHGALLAVGRQSDTTTGGTPSSILQDLRLALSPAPTITGRVYAEDGARVAAAIAQLYQFRYAPLNGRSLVPLRSIFTDDNGEYRMFWLRPGQYVVSAAHSDYVLQPWKSGIRFTANLPDPDNRYPLVYFPGTLKSSEVCRSK
jgi:protocatechuate 3,4-dioxygenase beta subunit